MASEATSHRIRSVDAYRGCVMVALMVGGGIARLADVAPDTGWIQVVAAEFRHVPWVGCSLWDLVMPAFLLLAGLSLPYSNARREREGQPYTRRLGHVILRSLLLVALGIWLSSPFSMPTIMLTYVLPQIGLGYTFVFLAVGRPLRTQLGVAIGILAAYWLAFVLYPVPEPGFDYASVGNLRDGDRFDGLFAHWNKNTNLAAAFDAWFLNLFPRPRPFVFEHTGVQTLNFIPSIATMIFGVVAAGILRSQRPRQEKAWALVEYGFVLTVSGAILGLTVCPIVKSIWTPSWAIFSAGLVVGMLAGFYWLVDIQGWRKASLPLVVVGMNSILVYSMWMVTRYWVLKAWRLAFGDEIFAGDLRPVLESFAFGLSLWLVAAVLYRWRIFLRI